MNLSPKPGKAFGEASSAPTHRRSCKDQHIMNKRGLQSHLQHSRLIGQAYRMVDTGHAAEHHLMLVGGVGCLAVGCLLGASMFPRSQDLKVGEALK